jgi:CHASE2 domain-containing sensor protein
MLRGFVPIIVLVFALVWILRKIFIGLNHFIPASISTKYQFYFHPRLQHFFANLTIGLLVFGLLTFIQHFPLVMDTEDANLDFAMQVNQDTIPATKKMPSFVFLDIDNQTHKLWGEPFFTPRNKIKELIDVAVKAGARLVIVDVDLSQKTPIEGLKLRRKVKLHPYDKDLYNYMAGYKKYCKKNTKCPPIILARVFRPLPDFAEEEDEKISDWFRPDPEPIRESRTGFLETAVAKSAPYVQWASPLFLSSSLDNVIRRWWLWQPICTEKQPEVIPSIQLLAAAMIRLETPQQAQERISTALADFKPKYCSDIYMPKSESSKPIKIAEGLEITEGMYGIRQRIIYNMPWRFPQNITENWTVRYFLLDYDKETQEREVILTVFSAQPYLNSLQANTATALKDKIVVIGGSYSDGGDMHATPLDAMPGGLIIINAIHSLLRGELKLLSAWNNIGLAILLILIMSFILAFIDSFWIVVFSGILTLALVPVTAFLLKEGVWMNFALPLLAVHVQDLAATYREMAMKSEPLQVQQKNLAKLAKEMEHSITKQLHGVLMDNLSKMTEQYNKMGANLTEAKIPPAIEGLSKKTTTDSVKESESQQDKSFVDKLTALEAPSTEPVKESESQLDKFIVVDKLTALEESSNKTTQNLEEVSSKQQQDKT